MVARNRNAAPVPGAPNSQSGLANPGAAAAAAADPPDLGAVHQQLAALQAQLNLLAQAPAPQQPPPHLAFDETSRLLFLSEAALRQHFNVAPADPLPPHIQLTSFPSRDAALAAHPDLVDRTAPPPPPPNPNPPLPQPYLPPPPDPHQQAPPFPAVQGGATSFVTDEAYNANVTFVSELPPHEAGKFARSDAARERQEAKHLYTISYELAAALDALSAPQPDLDTISDHIAAASHVARGRYDILASAAQVPASSRHDVLTYANRQIFASATTTLTPAGAQILQQQNAATAQALAQLAARAATARGDGNAGRGRGRGRADGGRGRGRRIPAPPAEQNLIDL